MYSALHCLPCLLCLLLAACKPTAQNEAETEPPVIVLPKEVEELAPAKAAEWMVQNSGAVILDLRMPEELAAEGRLPGAVNVDYLQSKTLEYIATLDRQKPVFLFCALGGRSRHMAVEMHTLGFRQISLLKGGLNAWVTEGRAVQK